MNHPIKIERPETLKDVADQSDTLQDFGMNLRDWQHTIQRGGVHSRAALQQRLAEPPPRLADRFAEGEIADAYLAAYAEWLADQAGIPRPDWCTDLQRIATDPWFATPLRGHLIAVTPASFRQRNLFTVPENIFTSKPGRPRCSADHKHKKARLRQKAYRDRVRILLAKARTPENT